MKFAGCQKVRVNDVKLMMFQSSGGTEFLGLWTYTRLCLSVFWGYGVLLGYVDCALSIHKVCRVRGYACLCVFTSQRRLLRTFYKRHDSAELQAQRRQQRRGGGRVKHALEEVMREFSSLPVYVGVEAAT